MVLLTKKKRTGKVGDGAENTLLRRTTAPTDPRIFLCPDFSFLFLPRASAGRVPNTRPFGGIMPPTLAGFQRPAPILGVNPSTENRAKESPMSRPALVLVPFHGTNHPFYPVSGFRFVFMLNKRQWQDFLQVVAERSFSFLQIIQGLEVEPVLWSLPKNPPKPQSQFRRNGTSPIDHMGDAHGRDPGSFCKFDLGDLMFFQNLSQEDSRVKQGGFLACRNIRKIRFYQVIPKNFHEYSSLMIINDFHVFGVSVFEAKTETPLFVDPEAPLTFSVSLEGFQAIRNRDSQVIEFGCRIDLSQSLSGPFLNLRRKPLDEMTGKKPCGFFVGKRENHEQTINELFISVKGPFRSGMDVPLTLLSCRDKVPSTGVVSTSNSGIRPRQSGGLSVFGPDLSLFPASARLSGSVANTRPARGISPPSVRGLRLPGISLPASKTVSLSNRRLP